MLSFAPIRRRANLEPVREVGALVGLGLALALGGCTPDKGFQCAGDDGCQSDGVAGTCESIGYCSFPDDTCPSGRRYGELAEGLSGVCVDDPSQATSGTTTEDPTSSTSSSTTDPGESSGPVPAVCGDGVADDGEACDGTDLREQSCADLGLPDGTLVCTASCDLDATGCSVCGDGQLGSGEDCDGTALGGETCESQGFDDGTLSCTPACGFDTTNCSSLEGVPINVHAAGDEVLSVTIGASCAGESCTASAEGTSEGWMTLVDEGCTVLCPPDSDVTITLQSFDTDERTEGIEVILGRGADYDCPGFFECERAFTVSAAAMEFACNFSLNPS